MLTSRLAREELTGKVPHFLPGIRTIPIPYSAASASILAASMKAIDSCVAVAKPNV